MNPVAPLTLISGTYGSGGYVNGIPDVQGVVGTITGALPSVPAGTVTFTAAGNSVAVGQSVSIINVVSTPATAFNVSNVVVTAKSGNDFTVAANVSGAYGSGGLVTTLGANKVYTQDNYWRVDDHSYTGTLAPGTATSSAFIANISQWCSTCHTRYMASGSGSRRFASGDSVFKFRHTSGSTSEGSTSCLQCHVAHGTNAQMTGSFSSNLPTPAVSVETPAGSGQFVDSGSVPTSTSRLLRVNNRGICLMCHESI
jgi:nitrate reductase cytochrome c-type subunit